MAPINKKIRAVIKKYNSDGENSTINSSTCYTAPTTTVPTTSNATAVITTASSSSSPSILQIGQFSDSNNASSSDPDQTESSSRRSGTPQSDESGIVRDKDYPNLSFVGHQKGSTSILSPLSVSSKFGKLLHSVSQRPEPRNFNDNFNINHQCIVLSPASSPFDSHSQPYSASSSSSSFSPSPSTSTQDKFTDSPSNVFLYENGTRRKSVISGGDRYSPNTSRKETYDESSNEQQHPFNLHSQYKNSTKSSEGNSSNGQSGKITLDKSSEEYRLRRERNNIAVRKSRSKSKIKFQQTIDRVSQLEEENSKLRHHIGKMSQELAIFKYLLEKYQDENYKRFIKLDNVDAMEIPPEISMINRLEMGSDRFQIRNFGSSRSNINPFYRER